MSTAGFAVAGATRLPAAAQPATTRMRPASVPVPGTGSRVGDDATRAIEACQFLESITAREPRQPGMPGVGARGAHPGSE
jgi:hypothetical protein